MARASCAGCNTTFWHQTVTGQQIEDYISAQSGIDLSKVFAQYLTTTKIPVLEYSMRGNTLTYRWTNVVPGFDMPVRVTLGSESRLLRPDRGVADRHRARRHDARHGPQLLRDDEEREVTVHPEISRPGAGPLRSGTGVIR